MSQFEVNKSSLYQYIESQNWHYSVMTDNETTYTVSLGMKLTSRLGQCRVYISASGSEIQAYAVSPINAKEDTVPNVVEYITRANHGLVVGAFDFDYSDGEVRFHTCLSSKAGTPSQEDIERTVDISYIMMERYGDGLVKNLMGFGNPELDIRIAEGN